MTATIDRDALLDGAALVRLHTRGVAQLLDELPRYHAKHPVTLSVDGFDLDHQTAASLTAHGYTVAGRCPHLRRDVRASVDLLVTRDARAAAPHWWSQVRGQATKIYDLRMGPVRVVLDNELNLHLSALAP